MALVAGEIQRIEQPLRAALAGQLQSPAIEGIEDGCHRLLLPGPAGADDVEGLPAQGAIRARKQVARLGQPHLFPLYGQANFAHQIVVEVAPGVQAIGTQPYHQLLCRHRQALILQASLMAQAIILLRKQWVLHQRLELGLWQPQHQIFHRCQSLEQVRIEGAGTRGQLLGERIPGILAAL